MDFKILSTLSARKSDPLSLSGFAKETIVYGIGNILTRAGSFLLIPLYTHNLSMKDYGLLATLTTFIELLFIIMHMGLRTGILCYWKEYEEKSETGRLFGTAIIMNILGGLIVMGASVFLFSIILNSFILKDEIVPFTLLMNLSALMYSLFIIAITYYRGNNDAVNFVKYSICGIILLVCLNFVFLIYLRLEVKGVLLAQVFTYLIMLLYVVWKLKQNVRLKICFKTYKKLLHFGFPLIFGQSGSVIIQATSFYFLTYFNSLENVAIYSLGIKLAAISEIILISSFNIAYEPFVFKNIESKGIRQIIGKILTYLMVTYTGISFAILLLSRNILDIAAPKEYGAALIVLIMVLPTIAFRGVYYVGEALLNASHKSNIVGYLATFFTIACIGINYFLIENYGIFGAIVGTGVTTILNSVAIISIGLKYFPIKIEWKRLLIISLFFIVLVGLFTVLKESNYCVYYFTGLFVFVVGFVCSYVWGFWFENEKKFMRKALQGIRL